jgi:DNA-binding response OmpR family regulator
VTLASSRRIAIVADDLLWSERLAAQARQAEAEPVRVRGIGQLEAALRTGIDLVVVDLTSRSYDGLGAVRLAAKAGCPVLALGQHDDRELRVSALEAGAERVLAYRKMAADGAAVLSVLLAEERTPTRRMVDRPAGEGRP